MMKGHPLRSQSLKSKDNETNHSTTNTEEANEKKKKSNRAKPRQQAETGGLDGNYWSTARSGRQGNRPKFDHSDVEEADSSSEPERALMTRHRLLLYSRRTFLTCRSPADAFYLCQLLQDVYDDTKQVRIRWCSLVDPNADEMKIDETMHFKLDYEDILDPQAILTNISKIIRHSDKTVSLRKEDIAATNEILQRSIKGQTTDDPQSKSKKKRARIASSGEPAPVKKRRRTKDINEILEGDKKEVKPKPISKAKLFKVQSNRFLKENLAITRYQVEPFFEDNLPVPFISSSVQSKLAIRAVMLNDAELLQSLIDDIDRVSSVHIRRNLSTSPSAIHYAIKHDRIELLRILLKDLANPKSNRCPFPQVTLKTQTTGHASVRMLGFKTAKVMASRGAREGNNALIKDPAEVVGRNSRTELMLYAVQNNCSFEVLDLLVEEFGRSVLYGVLVQCIQSGHRKLTLKILDAVKQTGYDLNTLHREVITFEQEALSVNSASDVIEKTRVDPRMTPIHCAAINPNGQYLKQLLNIVKDYNLADKNEQRPIHYAAACEGTEPLEYLLSEHVNFNQADVNGNSPLHIAVTFGRENNAELLLRTAKEKAESDDSDELSVHEKFGLASINIMNKSRLYPLHLAVINNHLECVKVLIQYGARIDGFTTVTKEKLTPLMLACQHGYLDIVIYLIEQGAKVEGRDRFKRTPLIHACMYGNAHIVSYLLRRGANANVFDSSSNTALHYAIAYGWYFCVRLLMEAGASITAVNCWQTTCLLVGFSKGHYGICDYLLTEHHADVNFQTDEGLTLVMITAELEVSSFALQQLEYVVIKHHADCTRVDINGRNAFHYFALNQCDESVKKTHFRMAQVLLDHQCNPLQLDNKAQTPLMLAFERKNSLLVEFFINVAKLPLTADVNHDGKTLLHYFAVHCDDHPFTQILLDLPVTDELKKMGQIVDNDGRTPLHYCVAKFDEFCSRPNILALGSGMTNYQSIVRMIHYCLETIGCDPDFPIGSQVDDVRHSSIFYLLRNYGSSESAGDHPLDLFLQKTKSINALHYQTRRTPLLEAIRLKELTTIKKLLLYPSCDINLAPGISSGELQQTPLILACKMQYLPVIRLLLNDPRCELLRTDAQKDQAFHLFLAVSQRSDDYLDVFQLFVEKLKSIGKEPFSSQGESNKTPIHIAVCHNPGTVDTNYDVEHTLIENGCDLFIQDNRGNLPLHNVFSNRRTGEDPVELCALIMEAMKYQSLDTKNNEGNTPLHLAVVKASTVCVMLLLKRHANLLIENNLSNSVLAVCIASNHVNLLITFFHQPTEIDLSQFYTQAKGSVAEPEDQKQVWQWRFLPKPKNKPAEQQPLIHMIVQRDWQGALALILDEVDRFHLKYIQLFEAAILNNRLNLILRIKNRTVLHEKNSQGRNLFHLMTIHQRNDQPLVEKLLLHLRNHQVNWNVPDHHGSYPLHYACALQNSSFIKFLKNKYPDELNFNQTDAFGNTGYGLLFWSSANQNSFKEDFLQTLITSGHSLDCLCNYDNETARNPLSFGLINFASNQTIPYPPEQLDSSSTTCVRTSPLINAIVHQHYQLAKFLIELGADVNFPDEEKQTPLMHAVRQNNLAMVKLLLNREDKPEEVKSTVMLPTRKKPRNRFFLGVTTTDASIESDDDENEVSKQMETNDQPEPVAKVCRVNLNATDELGQTCIHHLVRPFPDGSYTNNLEMLQLLHSCGASLTQPDQTGQSPFDHCLNNGYEHLYKKLRELMQEQPMDVDDIQKKRFTVNDPNKELLGLPDYYADAQDYIDQYTAQHQSELRPSVYQVDPLSGMSQTGEVMIDATKNEPYDVRLTITDMDYGLIGLYNFYRMQIIKHKTKNLYLLLTRWGRIGDGDGQHQLTPYSTFDECRAEFCKIFRDKTGNQWEQTDQFQIKPKKYNLIQLSERQTHKYLNIPIDFQRLQDAEQHSTSKLHSDVYKNLFQLFLNPGAIRNNLKKCQLDVEWMPVSQLKPETLQKARDILLELKQFIEQKEKLKLTIQQLTDEIAAEEQKVQYKQLLESICKLNNEYYSLIPLEGYGGEKLPMIDSEAAVKKQQQQLDDILELELSYKILLAAEANLNQISPIDYLYKSINCQFEAMERDALESQLILRYIWASASATQVERIFKIARPNDDERLQKRNLGNHYLLWHGTNICNLISILTRGLLVGPLCATTTGSLFGKGIYTADAFDKSLQYCSGVYQGDGEHCFMLLCQVALGTSQVLDYHDRDFNEPLDVTQYQSRHASGRQIPDPRYTITRNDGVQMPLGGLIESTDRYAYRRRTYSEYIVFDESQIALRYLVQFRR